MVLFGNTLGIVLCPDYVQNLCFRTAVFLVVFFFLADLYRQSIFTGLNSHNDINFGLRPCSH